LINIPKKVKKGSGQGLVEYALILVLVAIVVIASLMILWPIVQNVINQGNSQDAAPRSMVSDPNRSALSDAPFIREGVNKPFLVPLYPEDYLYDWYIPGCHPLISPPDGFGLKVGTISESSDGITITKNGDTYSLCNDIQGHQVAIISTFVPLPQ
jgi:Flp pilus assembly pilin Flp